jgi:6-phosphogluconolactonase (cycloisomerase 2 family)
MTNDGSDVRSFTNHEKEEPMSAQRFSLGAIASIVILLCIGQLHQPFAVQFRGAILDDHYDGLSAIAMSPDQRHAYAVSLHGGVFWFNCDAGSGQLALQGEATWLLAGSNMIGGATIALSPDGKHLYLGVQNGLHWFACNTVTGALTYGGQVLAPADTSVHLNGNFSLALGPDGHQVYIASWYGHAVHWFQRDAVSGALTYAGRMRDSIDVPRRMTNPSSIALTPNGTKLLVTSYSSRSLSLFSRNATSGALTLDSTYIDSTPGSNGMLAARSVAVSPDGKDAYVGTAVGTLARFRFGTNGAFVYNGTITGALAPASALTMSPDGQFLYAGDWNSHTISWFRRDSTTGALISSNSLLGSDKTPTGGALPASLVISANGAYAYAVGRDRSCVTVLSRSAQTGALTVSTLVRNTLTNITDMGGAYAVAVSRGADVYVAAATDDAINRFTRNTNNGSLTFDTSYIDIRQATFGAGGPYWLGLSPDQKFLYAACYGGLYWYGRDQASGRLTMRGSESRSGLSPVKGTFSPDGRFLYLSYESGHAVMWFSRDSVNGTLTFVANVNNKMDSITDMYSPDQAVVSPDGRYVYVPSGFAGQGVFWFNRNATNGSLTYGGKILNNAGGITILTDPSALAVSPNGKYIYVGCGSSIVWLSRDSMGTLKISGSLSNTLTGLLPATSLQMSADGLTLYETMGLEVAWYNIDTAKGTASLAGAIGGTLVGGQALWGIEGGALSPGGDYLYTAASNYGAVAWFSTNANNGVIRSGAPQHAQGAPPLRFHSDAHGRLVATGGAAAFLFDLTGRRVPMMLRAQAAGIYFAKMREADAGRVAAVPNVK